MQPPVTLIPEDQHKTKQGFTSWVHILIFIMASNRAIVNAPEQNLTHIDFQVLSWAGWGAGCSSPAVPHPWISMWNRAGGGPWDIGNTSLWIQGSQPEPAESLALLQPGLVLYGGTRAQAGDHGVLEVSQGTVAMLDRPEAALPAALLLVNGCCSPACPGLKDLGAASPWHSHRGAAQSRGHVTLRPPYSCSAVRKGHSSTWWKHHMLQNQGDSVVLDTHPCLSLPKTQDLPSVAPDGIVRQTMALHVLGLLQGYGSMSQYDPQPLSPIQCPWVMGEWPPHVPPQPRQRLLLLQVSAPLSAKGVNEGALLLLAFLVPFLWELIHLLLYFLHNNNSAAQGKFARGKKKKTMSANCGLFYLSEKGWKLEEDKCPLGVPCSCQHRGSAAGSSHDQLA